MDQADLERWARQAVDSCLNDLPPEIAFHARRVAILFRDFSGSDDHPDVAAGELLGLFSGLTYAQGEPAEPGDMPRITLFLQTIWEEAGEDPVLFRDEVRITFLHELGHYLGWDEHDLEIRGLD